MTFDNLLRKSSNVVNHPVFSLMQNILNTQIHSNFDFKMSFDKDSMREYLEPRKIRNENELDKKQVIASIGVIIFGFLILIYGAYAVFIAP